MADQNISIGVLAALFGPFAQMGEDGVRGVELAISEFDGQVGGKPIKLIVEGTNAIPENAEAAAKKLIEREHVDFIVGPLSGNEGLAVRDYAKTCPERAFLNGTAAAQEITLRDAAPNFFNFMTNGVQWMAGLGSYVYHTLGFKRIVTIAENYSYPHGQVGGLMIEFCGAGGKVIKKFWVPLGTSNFSSVIAAIPANIDAIFAALSGADALNFLKQYAQAGGTAPLIAGSTTVDQTVFGIRGSLLERVVGIVSAGPIADDNPAPAWQSFVQAYQQQFPGGLPFPSQVAFGYYVNTKAALLALSEVGGDLGDRQTRFIQALGSLEFECPTGPVRLDHNRQAIANNFITVVAHDAQGTLHNHLVQTIPDVNQTLGMAEDDYLDIGPLTADNPNCP